MKKKTEEELAQEKIINEWRMKTVDEKINDLNTIIAQYPDIPERAAIIKQREELESAK